MKRILAFFLLLFCASLAFADSSNSNILNPDAVNQFTDMSVYYLSQIFGTVGSLTSNSSELMGHLFYKLNWGIFLISSVMVFYAVLIGTIRLASEGVTMAPGKSTLFSLMKLAIGVALVIPSAGTGYSLLQNIVMEVVVKGVGLADSVWSAGLDYLNSGGVVWSHQNSMSPVDKYNQLFQRNNIDHLLGTSSQSTGPGALAQQVFQNEVCMVGSRDPISNNQVSNGSNSIVADGTTRPYYDIQEDDTNSQFRFPGLTDSDMSHSSCGTISWNVGGACSDGASSSNCAIARNAMSKLVYGLLPAAKQYYCYQNSKNSSPSCQGEDPFPSSGSDTPLNVGLSPYLVGALVNYYPSIQAYADIVNKGQANAQTDFINNAKKEGWLMAGRYYWNVMQFVRLDEASSDLSSYTTAQMTGPDASYSGTNLKDTINSSFTDFVNAKSSSSFQADMKDLVSLNGSTSNEKYSGWMINKGSEAAIVAPISVENVGIGATFALIFYYLDQIGEKFKNWNNYHYNPIEFFYQLGQECLKVTMMIWVVGGVLIGAGVMIASICSASNPIGFGSAAIAEWVKPIFMLVASMLWLAGFFLCYYVPLYPFMVFLFASFGWFISVIEAMVAAPLVALGLTHPEEHDLLGKSQQALMLLLSVFAQPSLLVLGLMAGIILSYVSFDMLIYSFSGFIADIMGGGVSKSTTDILAAVQSSTLYDGTNVLVAPVLLLLFCTITYTLLTQSFSLVYLLRDNVMKWIGAPTTGLPSPEQMLHDTKGAVSSMGSQGGQAVGSGISRGSEATAAEKKAKVEQAAKASMGAPSGGGGAA